MEDRGCTPNILRDLYINKNMTQTQIKTMFSIKDDKVLHRWFAESGIERRKERGVYKFNRHFFDKIDTEEKAYWLGFIWCDGYVCKRKRKGGVTYEFKLDLAVRDKEHVEKFKNALESDHPVNTYKNKTTFDKENEETEVARLYLANKHFAKSLYEKYGLVANRSDADKLIKSIPDNLIKHFIRGVLDADGGISNYHVKEERLTKPTRKMAVRFYTYENLLVFIREYFINIGLSNFKQQFRKRHEDRDGFATELSYTGNQQVPIILDYLYDEAHVYLQRKFDVYKTIKNNQIRDDLT